MVPYGTDVNTLLYYSDVVIGFFSNILIESRLMNKPVIRFLLNDKVQDPFHDKNIGIIAYPNTIADELKLLL